MSTANQSQRALCKHWRERVVRQISVNSGVSTALYDQSINLGKLILVIMGDIFKIRGNRDMLCVSQERVVKEVRVIIQNGRRQRHFFGVEIYSIANTVSDRSDLLKYV